MATQFFRKNWRRLLLFGLLAVLTALYAYNRIKSAPKGDGPPKAQSVRAAQVRHDTVSVYFQALGTVTPPRTVTVRSRVDGELTALHFTEGQRVREGDLLAEIDPRPFEVQKAQALGALARDEASLKDARLDLQRYRKLIKEKSISQQQLQSQEALVGQYEGAVIADKAAVADAELQLTYSRVTAPATGRVGLRKVDVGNIIRSTDTDGIVVITQMRPMEVVFTLVEKQIAEVLAAMRKGDPLLVEAWSQDGKKRLASGALLSLDNQIDTATGTVKAKAVFQNREEMLFPNQFVNIKLRVNELKDVLVIPTSAVQRNNKGFFVYVVEDGRTIMRDLKTGYATDTLTVAEDGLELGEIVVIDGVDRLREGSEVTIRTRSGNATSRNAPGEGGKPDQAPARSANASSS